MSGGREGSGLDFSRDPLVLGRPQGTYLEGRISPFPFFPWIWVRGRGEEMISRGPPLESVSDARSHMLFEMGWVRMYGWGRFTVL